MLSVRRGFTIWEFIVVVAIMGILAAILMPVGSGGRIRRQSIRQSCHTNLQQIALGFKQYVQDFDGILPASQSGASNGWSDVIRPYVKKPYRFWCPENTNQPTGNVTDYFYNAHLSKLTAQRVIVPSVTILIGDGDFAAPSGTAIEYLPENWREDKNSPAFRHLEGANYAFADGHVKWLKPEKITLDSPRKSKNGTFLPR